MIENDGDDVISKLYINESKNLSIHPGGARNLSLFARVDRRERRSESVGRARFHFDETQNIRVVAD